MLLSVLAHSGFLDEGIQGLSFVSTDRFRHSKSICKDIKETPQPRRTDPIPNPTNGRRNEEERKPPDATYEITDTQRRISTDEQPGNGQEILEHKINKTDSPIFVPVYVCFSKGSHLEFYYKWLIHIRIWQLL